MKCNQAQQILVNRESGGILPSKVEQALEHAHTCRKCADILSFDRQLQEALHEDQNNDTPHLLGAIRENISQPLARTSWMQSNRKTKLMKQLTFSAAFVTIAATIIVGSISGNAQAATAKERFASMKKAMLANKVAVQDGNGQHYIYKINGITTKEAGDGVLDLWIKADGQLIEYVDVVYLPINGGDGKKAGGNYVDLTLKEAKPTQLKLNLSPKAYKSIDFGPNKNTLVLAPKDTTEKYIVRLDSKSSLPTNIQMIRYSVKLNNGNPGTTKAKR